MSISSNFLNGSNNDDEIFTLLEMCRDANGRIDYDQIEALAIATGHYNEHDMGIINAAVIQELDSLYPDYDSPDYQGDDYIPYIERTDGFYD